MKALRLLFMPDAIGFVMWTALAFGLLAPVAAIAGARDPVPPKKLVLRKSAEKLADYGRSLTTEEALYCRMQRGTPLGGRYCDFGVCQPCQSSQWPCSVRTIVCRGGECGWGGR